MEIEPNQGAGLKMFNWWPAMIHGILHGSKWGLISSKSVIWNTSHNLTVFVYKKFSKVTSVSSFEVVALETQAECADTKQVDP